MALSILKHCIEVGYSDRFKMCNRWCIVILPFIKIIYILQDLNFPYHFVQMRDVKHSLPLTAHGPLNRLDVAVPAALFVQITFHASHLAYSLALPIASPTGLLLDHRHHPASFVHRSYKP